MSPRRFGLSTTAIHGTPRRRPDWTPIAPSVVQSSTFTNPVGSEEEVLYTRYGNTPNQVALAAKYAQLEGAEAALFCGSGMGATALAHLAVLRPGDHLVSSAWIYGGTRRLFDDELSRLGMQVSYVDPQHPRQWRKAVRKTTRALFVETPTNPLMALSDIAAIAEICKRKKVELVVDNTFMSPFFQQPIALGADMVVHSTTKFLNGHSDGLGGVVVCTRQEQAEQLGFVQKAAGAILSPFECWLVLRGVKTLAVRMLQHDSNGRKVAEFLASHNKVKKVFYPGLKDHPQYELASRQMTGFGSMITFETGSLANAGRLLKRVRVCTLGESLGGVETLISHPATMTHAALGEKGRAAIGITDGMVRISVGIEDVDDIIADLEQALA